MPYAHFISEFDPPLFRIGQRVWVDVEYCDPFTAIVWKIDTQFTLTPKHRRFRYWIWLDEPATGIEVPERTMVDEDQLSEYKDRIS